MSGNRKILVTSALPYANGPLHLGHIAGAYLPADIYVRYQRLKGRDVIYICGSDEHGVPITVRAEKEGVTPQDVVDRFHAMNKKGFADLGISFDHYSRTSLAIHYETASEFFIKLHEQGDLAEKEEEQFYSEASRKFLPDRYVEGVCPHCEYEKARGDQCDNCGKWLEPRELVNPRSLIDGSEPVLKKTSHWYLPMGRFADEWKSWFDRGSWKDNVERFSMGWYKEGLRDRPITRDLSWGVPVPLKGADGKVLYVWFDAPIGYISATKEWAQLMGEPEKWRDYWCDKECKLVHFIGKDNIVFHAILFPMILMRIGGYVLPESIPANEYLTIEVRKISTSQNYAIWLKDYLESFPPDPLRYTLAANAPENKDTDFSWKQLQSRNNDELADILGNFVNRTLAFCHRYFNGKVPEKGRLDSSDSEMLDSIDRAPEEMGALLEAFEVRKAAKYFMDVCRSANKYFNDQAPWETVRKDAEKCGTTIHISLQVCRVLGIIMAPILPFASEKLLKLLNIEGPLQWDDHNPLKSGDSINKAEILFAKIDDETIEKESARLTGSDDKNGDRNLIEPDVLRKAELRVGRVLQASKVEKADKLLKLSVDLGGDVRQIVAGVASSYEPSELIGRTVIVAANLKPAVIRGIESNGMLLAADTGKGFALLTTDRDVTPGAPVQ